MAQRLRTGIAVFLCILVGFGAITAGAAPAAAQDTPPLPAVYHGELTVADGTVDSPVLVEVVADGTVQDSIITDANGAIGGPTISDDKLEVQEPEETDIEFHVGGSPVTIVSVDNPEIEGGDDSIPFAEGDQEIELEATTSDLEPTVAVDITDAPDSVEPDSTVNVDITIENTGPVATSSDIELRDFNDTVVDTAAADLEIGESATTVLTWEPTMDDTGDGDITVQAGNTTATHSLTVESVSPPAIAQPSPDDGAEDDGDTDLPDGVAGTNAQEIVSDEEFGLSQVRFTDATAVESVTWNTADLDGTVTATTFTEVPNETSSPPGAMISLSEIVVPETAQDEPATLQFTAAESELTTAGADAENLQVYHFVDNEWTAADTEIAPSDDPDIVLVQAEIESFSYFAVSATSEPTAAFDIDPAEPDTETPVSLNASESDTEFGEIVAYDWTINGDSMSGELVETTFSDAGSVEIELTVENDAGETNTTTQSISVAAVDDEDGTEGETTDDRTFTFAILAALLVVILSAAVVFYRRR